MGVKVSLADRKVNVTKPEGGKLCVRYPHILLTRLAEEE